MPRPRPAPIRILAALLAIGSATAPASCIEDLPAATHCPPEPKRHATSCADALTFAKPGCLTDDPTQVACLTGPRDTCRCTSSDCPVRNTACYPDGDCPATVTERAASAVCKRLAPEDIGLDQPSETMCLCGCAGCAAVCDGVGPVMGIFTGSGVEKFPVLFDIKSKMPDRGTFGMYLRVRGLANVSVLVGTGDIDDFENIHWVPGYFVLTPPGTDYVEHVLYDDDFIHGPAYTWTSAADKPAVIALAASFDDTEENLALFELDCLVPFVVPR
jgi:hypothetical protein